MNSIVHNIDCMEGMKQYPDKYFELAIVDPPYGINAPNMKMGAGAKCRGKATSAAVELKKGRLNSGGGKLKNRNLNTSSISWDYKIPESDYFSELIRVSKNQIIWGGNYFPLPPTRCILAWNKLQPWENFSQFEMAWTSFDSPAGLLSLSNTGGGNHETKIHPTQKPVDLYKWVMNRYTKPGDKILDTHLGSGSSRIAAYDLGFDFTGYEMDKDYYEAQERRFANHIKQQSLFKPQELTQNYKQLTIE